MSLITPISAADAGILDAATPATQRGGLGSELKETQDNLAVVEAGAVYVLIASITAAANSTAKAITVPFACEVLDVVVQARATVSNGTATLRSTTTAITDAIVMAADTVVTRAGTIDDSVSTLAAGANLNVITANSGDRGLVSVFVRRTA